MKFYEILGFHSHIYANHGARMFTNVNLNVHILTLAVIIFVGLCGHPIGISILIFVGRHQLISHSELENPGVLQQFEVGFKRLQATCFPCFPPMIHHP